VLAADLRIGARPPSARDVIAAIGGAGGRTISPMAISFSRPDPSSPAAVADANFGTARRGFEQQEVRDFLRMVAAELARLQERERFLERELRSAQPPAAADVPAIDEDTATRLLGEETARILTMARESGAHIKERAEEGAARLLRESTDEANRQRQEAEVEAARRRSDASADAEAELTMAKQQGREMVEEARAYRERVLSELTRRRELARQQIDQLVHGRDRLVQAFERARLVAADVVAEMTPLGEPDEYVDLTPTTGPVPLTVPAGRIGEQSSVADVAMPGELDDDEPHPFVTDVTGSMPLVTRPDEVTTDIDDDEEPPADAALPAGEDGPAKAAPEESAAPEGVSNVVAFPAPTDEATDQPATDEPATDEPATDDVDQDDDATASDVDQIFARLRAGRPADEPAVDAVTAVDDADRADGDADAATPFSARKLKRRLADEQNEILAALRRQEPVTNLDVLVPWASEQSARYTDAISAELAAAAQAGAASMPGAGDLDLGQTGVLAPTRETLATDLVAPLRERLERIIIDADGDNDVIAKKVRGLYREWKSQRIDEHLDDLVRGAYTRAAAAAVAAGTRVRWIVDPDGPASPDCEDNSLAEPVVVGDGFPTGHTGPPAHPGCRCLLTTVED